MLSSTLLITDDYFVWICNCTGWRKDGASPEGNAAPDGHYDAGTIYWLNIHTYAF